MTTLGVRVLGGFQITRTGESVAELPARIQALITNTLLHRNAPRSRQQLAYTFWPESTDKQARTNLRRLLLLLRRALPQTDELFDITPSAVGWNPQIPVSVDLFCFEDGLAAAPASAHPRRAALDAAVACYTGDLLPDCYDEWILPERERLRNALADALDELVLLAENERDYPAAITYARRLLRHDPLHEASYRRLMRLLALTGDRAGALQVYHTCATFLRRELGVDPSPETQQTYERLLHQNDRPHTLRAKPLSDAVTSLVGRQKEWSALQQAWRGSNRGASHWILISGEAGMGKSRLAEEMLAWAERQGIAAAQSRSYASIGSVSYSPLIDLLRSDSLRAGWEKLADHWLAELARLLPEIHTSRPDLPSPSPLAEEWQKRRLFEALAQALTADGRPHLLVLDDLHWADRESLEFLAFFLRHPAPARLLLVGTARSEEMLDNPALLTIIREAEAQDQLTQLPLAPLTPAETAELAAQTGGTALDEEAVAALHADSGGNPLFVEEIVRLGDWRLDVATRQSPISQSPISPLPPKIQAVIEGRLSRLSPSAREVAAQAAVLGRSFTYPVLAAATALDEAGLVDGLDELWRRRIIREVGVGGDGYDFSHDRIRDVAYGVISAARRRLLHRRTGEALLQVHDGELDAVQGQLGTHFAAAGEELAAIEHYQQAAAVALERYARAEAADYLTAAIALAEGGGDAAVYPLLAERERVNRLARRTEEWGADLAALAQTVERLEDGSRDAIRRRAGLKLAQHYHQSLMGDRNRALELAQEAAVQAQNCADRPLESEALIRFGHELWGQGRFAEAQIAYEEGQAAAQAADLPSLVAESLERQAALRTFSGGSASHILHLLEESLRLYGLARHVIGEVNTLNKLGYLPVAQGSGLYDDAFNHYFKALEIAQHIGHRGGEATVQRNIAILYTCFGDCRRAGSCLNQTDAIIQQTHDGANQPIQLNYQGFWLLQQGRLDEAKATQQKALTLLRQQKQQLWAVKSITALGWIAFYEGKWQAAADRATQSITESETFNEERQIAHSCTLRGWARLKQDRAEEAIPDFQRSAEILQRLEMANRAQEPLAGLAQAAWQNGDLPAAQSQALPIARHLLSHPLDRTTDTFLAIHTIHAILRAGRDPLAEEVQALAQAHLEYRAANIEPEHLDAFWAMPGHKAIVAAEPISALPA